MSNQFIYKKFWLKHNIIRTFSAVLSLIFFPITITVVLWIEYWEEDVQPMFVTLLEVIKDWRTKND